MAETPKAAAAGCGIVFPGVAMMMICVPVAGDEWRLCGNGTRRDLCRHTTLSAARHARITCGCGCWPDHFNRCSDFGRQARPRRAQLSIGGGDPRLKERASEWKSRQNLAVAWATSGAGQIPNLYRDRIAVGPSPERGAPLPEAGLDGRRKWSRYQPKCRWSRCNGQPIENT